MSLHPDPELENTARRESFSEMDAFGADNQGRIKVNEQTLRDVFILIRKRLILIGLCTVGALLLGLAYCSLATPQYTATATVLVDKQAGIDLGILSSALSASGDSKTELETQVTLLKSGTTALAVAERLNLMEVAPYHPKAPRFTAFWSKPPVAVDTATLRTDPKAQGAFLYTFSKNLKVETQEDTRLILVHAVNPDPAESAQIANTVVEVYLQQYLENHFHATDNASKWVRTQLGALKDQENTSQKRLEDFAHAHGLGGMLMGLGASSSSGGTGGSGGGSSSASGAELPEVTKLNLINTELTAAEADRIEKEAIYRMTQTNSPDVVASLGGSTLATTSNSSVTSQDQGLSQLNALRLQQAGLKVSYADAASKFGKQNPHLLSLQDQMKSIDDEISKELVRINERAKSDFDLAQNTENQLRNEYDKQQAVVEKLNNNGTELMVLAAEAESSRQLYQGLVTTLQEASVQAGVKASNINLVDPARIPAQPTSPDWKKIPGFCMAGGLFLGVTIAFAIEALDDVIRTPDEVEGLTSYPVLASIPTTSTEKTDKKSGEGNVRPESSLLITNPRGSTSESFRALRTAIQLSGDINSLHSILITSPLSSEGKTTVSYNLAIAFAQQGKRTVVVDADMRKPRLHVLSGIGRLPGLSDILSQGRSWRDIAKVHPLVETLSIIPAGAAPPMPSELLSLPAFGALVEDLKKNFDMVFIDGPPLLLVTDPLIISEKVQGTICVIRSAVTLRTVLRRALEMLRMSRGRVLGLVLNHVDQNSAGYYYSYGYYGGGKYYEDDDASS